MAKTIIDLGRVVGDDGEAGPQGPVGATPSVTASATVDANVGTPSVTVTRGGTDEAPSFAFAFKNLKGEPGREAPEHAHDYLPLAGGTLTGGVAVRSANVPAQGETPGADQYGNQVAACDSSGARMGMLRGYHKKSGGRGVEVAATREVGGTTVFNELLLGVGAACDSSGARMGMLRGYHKKSGGRGVEVAATREVGGTTVFNELLLGVGPDGTRAVGVSDAAAWRSALSAAAANHTHAAATQSAAGLMSAADKERVDGLEDLAWKKVYPVGAVYISYVSTSPASLFGGTWVQITGRFPRFANDVATGGTARHRHWQTVGKATGESMFVVDFDQGFGYASRVRPSAAGARIDNAEGGFSAWTGSGGGLGDKARMRVDATSDPVLGVADDTTASTPPSDLLPPYQDLYAWRRTA